jgi:hypothetical protein
MSKNSLKGLNHKLAKKISGPSVSERILVEPMGSRYTQLRLVGNTQIFTLLFLSLGVRRATSG